MENLTKKEAAFVERIKKENIDLAKLEKRLAFLIKYCHVAAVIIILFILLIVFVVGETPKIYHLLAISSVFFVVLSQYINWKNTLKFIGKLKQTQHKENEE